MAKLRKAFELVRDYSGVISGFCAAGMMFSIVLDVLARQLGTPIYWVTDISLILIVWLAFLGMSWTQAERAHVRVDFLLLSLPKKVRPIIEMISHILSLSFCVMLLVAGTKMAIESVKIGEGTIGIVHMPVWPSRIVLAFGLLLLCLQLGIDVISEVKKILNFKYENSLSSKKSDI